MTETRTLAASAATEEDVRRAFRLFLLREPTESDWAIWRQPVADGEVPLSSLVDHFLNAPEYRGRTSQVLPPHPVRLAEFTIMVPSQDVSIGSVIERERVYERHVTAELRRRLRPGMVFVDVGANIGYFTLLAAALVTESGRVFAYEPMPRNCRLLRDSIAHNSFSNIELFELAVADRPGSVHLTSHETTTNAMMVAAEVAAVGSDLQPAEAVALDDHLPVLERLDVVKMDIEGAECLAWRGMTSLRERCRPTVIFELSPTVLEQVSGVSASDFLSEIESGDYALSMLRRELEEPSQPATIDQIFETLQSTLDAGLTHLDIVASPRR